MQLDLLGIATVILALLNVLVYYIFIKKIIKMASPAMTFLVINIAKDVLWCGIVLAMAERTKENFFGMVAIFVMSSFIMFYHVVRRINKL